MKSPLPPPLPPPDLPAAQYALLPGVGELFYRDSGPGTALLGTVLLLHGWIAPADVTWAMAYAPLVRAGYRVIALDHRGHGRGLRSPNGFRLADCAADAVGLLRLLETGPVIVAGYSMGGSIAQLMARDHSEQVAGLILCATALDWMTLAQRAYWTTMMFLELTLRLLPHRTWIRLLRRVGFHDPDRAAWVAGELSRGSARDLAEAGRELRRHDSRAWFGQVQVPIAVVCTTRDRLVSLRQQRRVCATARDCAVHDVAIGHTGPGVHPALFVAALLEAVDGVRNRLSRSAGDREVGASVDRKPPAEPAPRAAGLRLAEF